VIKPSLLLAEVAEPDGSDNITAEAASCGGAPLMSCPSSRNGQMGTIPQGDPPNLSHLMLPHGHHQYPFVTSL
jgi:hypothetical protein